MLADQFGAKTATKFAPKLSTGRKRLLYKAPSPASVDRARLRSTRFSERRVSAASITQLTELL